MSEELIPEQLSLDEQIDNKLIKANVTEAVIAELRERYLPLKIAGIDDKETYLTVKEGRKNCKAIRVIATKICKDGREDAVSIQKKWVAKEKEVTSRIAEVEDYLEAQEKAYETEVAAEKEARKRKQEEQLIMRQQELTSMGVLYSGGTFILGEVSFDLAAIKESDSDIWNEMILPKYKEAYQYMEAERIELDRIKAEKEAELKRQQEELERNKKELAEMAAKLNEEAERQAVIARRVLEDKIERRMEQLSSLGLYFDLVDDHYKGYDVFVPMLDIKCHDDDKWTKLIEGVTAQVIRIKVQEAEAKRKEQERVALQDKRFYETVGVRDYGPDVDLSRLWLFDEESYQMILKEKNDAFAEVQEGLRKAAEERAVNAERERMEEEQQKAEAERLDNLRKARVAILNQHELTYFNENGHLQYLSEQEWLSVFNRLKSEKDELIRKQEEERKAEELAKAGDKEKWNEIMERIEAIEVYAMRSSQYRKKAAILREKLEEIKAL